jgi:hypothetical protein
MISNIRDLFNREIQWSEETSGGTQFYAYIDGDLCQLKMNDYPDEPLYTLRWHDFSVDLDDRPTKWEFPPMP